jgi:hypothetical protein
MEGNGWRRARELQDQIALLHAENAALKERIEQLEAGLLKAMEWGALDNPTFYVEGTEGDLLTGELLALLAAQQPEGEK